MGSQNNKGKKKEKELINEAKQSSPILSNSKGRACTVEDGKIVLNFKNFQEEYNSLNHNLEKLKNKMNIIISNDIIELMQKKLEDLSKQAINEDIKNSINSFSLTYKTSLNNYYSHITEIKKVYKQGYLEIATFLTNWLKNQKDVEINEEKSKIQEFEKNLEEINKNSSIFNNVEELINKICYFKIDYDSKDKINEINNYFNENKDEINKNYNFENVAQLRSLVNLRDLLYDNILQKNNFVETLGNFHKEYLSLYIKVIEEINSNNIEKVEVVNEFNEYNSIIIYHRLIRSIEERIKKIQLD